MKLRCLVAVSVVLTAFAGSSAMNGKAVAILHGGAWGSTSSKMTISDINGGSVSTDTVLKAPAGEKFYYPAFSFDGTRVAFYHNGGVGVIDLATGSVRTVAPTVNWGGEGQEQLLAWPGANGGEWIYYHKPSNGSRGGGSGEVWKVNVLDTAQNVLICDYKKVDSEGSFMNFSLSADARYCVIRALGTPGSIPFTGGIWPHTFPPLVDPGTGWVNPQLTAPTNNTNLNSECNSGISASGNLICHFSGQHTSVYGVYWDHDAGTSTANEPRRLFHLFNDVEPALGVSFGNTPYFFMPRASSNSDKVFTVLVLWEMAQYFYGGSNLVVANWVDKEFVMPTNNPNPSSSGTLWIAESGDFWTSGGPDGCYQDISGNWLQVEGAAGVRSSIGNQSPLHGKPAWGESGTVYDLRGARVGTVNAPAFARRASPRLGRGAYVVAGEDALGKVMLINDNGSTRE